VHQILKIYPTEPGFHPEGAQEEMAIDALDRVLRDAGDVECESYAKPVWVDPGDALAAAICPRCEARLEVGPSGTHYEWWHEEALPTSWSGGESPLPLPCCGGSATFRELRTDPPTAFARFVIEVHAPSQGQELTAEDLGGVGQALGAPCRAVMAVYED
jgi:hypothetical protein